MNLQTIATRTALRTRTLRYVMDHKIVPSAQVRVIHNEAGRSRDFADDLGVGIACAAFLLEAGMRREAVASCIQILAGLNTRPDSPAKGITLVTVISKRLNAVVQFGDGVSGRLLLPEENIDSGWLSTQPLAKFDASYSPTVVVEIDIGRLLARLFDS